MNRDSLSAFANFRQSLASTCVSDSSIVNHEKDLKVDKRILDIMCAGGNHNFPAATDFFRGIIDKTQVHIDFSTFKDRQGKEIPIVKVRSSDVKNLEAASALIMERLDPHRDKMTFNIDVPYNDHSYIIGKDGSRIKQLSRETGCHIHLPDCNKTSGKKSNKLSIAGISFESIEQARNQIRKSLPLNIGFKAVIKSKKFVHIDTSSSEVQAIKRKYRVDVTFTNVISRINDTEVTINVKGGRSQLDEIKLATEELYQFVTGDDISTNSAIDFTISIDISHSHHQFVKGKNNCNLKVIHQRSKSLISFPPSDIEINQVLIQGKDLISTVMGWQELMGYLPLLLTFDVNFDIRKMQGEIQRMEKEYGVGIRSREKLGGYFHTIFIKTQERHSICMQEIRHRILLLKSKADRLSEESLLTKENWFYPKLNSLDCVSMNSNYLNCSTFAKSLYPNYYNYHQFPKVDIDQGFSSMKFPRLSMQSMDALSITENNRSLSSHNYNHKHKGSNKSSPVTQLDGMSPFYKSNQFMAESMTDEANSVDKSANISPLKPINLDLNLNTPFDYPPLSQTINSRSRLFPSDAGKVDYSFSRFTYQNSEHDSAIGSSIHRLSPTTINSIVSSTTPNDTLASQENFYSGTFNFLAKPFLPKISIAHSNR